MDKGQGISLVKSGELQSHQSSFSAGETYTLEQALNDQGFGRFQRGLLLYCGLAWFADAMEMLLLSFVSTSVFCAWDLSLAQKAWVTSVVFVGMFFGAELWGLLADAQGRKVAILIPIVITAVCGVLSALAVNYTMFLIMRFVVGFGLGGVHVALALAMEFLPTGSRGSWLVVLQGFWSIGGIVEAALGWIVLPHLGWRWLVGLSATPLIVLLALYPLLPESPHYLLAKGQVRAAEQVLQRLADVNGRPLPPGHLKAVPLEHTSQAPSKASGSFQLSQLFSKILGGFTHFFKELAHLFSSKLVYISSLLLIIWFANALAYYGVIQYTNFIHTDDGPNNKGVRNLECTPSGEPRLDAGDYRSIFVESIAEVPSIVIAYFTLDRLGRKPVVSASLFVVAIAVLVMLIVNQTTGVLTGILLFVSRSGMMLSFTGVMVYTPELYPTTIRSFGFGVDNSFSRIGGLITPFIVGLAETGNKRATLAIFGVMALVAGVCAILIPYETAGKPLRETLTSGAELIPSPGEARESAGTLNPAYGVGQVQMQPIGTRSDSGYSSGSPQALQ